MAIQNRCGEDLWFDPTKMLPGEFAVSTDKKRVYVAFAPGEVREFAFVDQIPIVGDVTPDKLQEAVNNYLSENPVQAGATEEQANQIERNKQNIEKTSTSDLKDNTVTFESIDDGAGEALLDIEQVKSGEKASSLFHKFSRAVNNIRFMMNFFSYLTSGQLLNYPELLTGDDDEDDITTPGIYKHLDYARPANCPSGSYNSILIVFKARSSDVFQIEFSANSFTAYYRVRFNGDWYNWKEFAFK